MNGFERLHSAKVLLTTFVACRSCGLQKQFSTKIILFPAEICQLILVSETTVVEV
jgi:hypothetical protein